jgi:hypothetical protein
MSFAKDHIISTKRLLTWRGAISVAIFVAISRPWIAGRDCAHYSSYLNTFQITLFKPSLENDFCMDYEGWVCGEIETAEAL